MDWLDLLAVQGTLKSLLQLHSSEASILQHSAFSMVQLSHPYMTNGKTIALTLWTFVGKVMSLVFNMQSWLVIVFLSRNKHLLIPWLKSPWNSPGQNTGMDSFSRGSSQPRDWTQVSQISNGFFTSWATREAGNLVPDCTSMNELSWEYMDCSTKLWLAHHSSES